MNSKSEYRARYITHFFPTTYFLSFPVQQLFFSLKRIRKRKFHPITKIILYIEQKFKLYRSIVRLIDSRNLLHLFYSSNFNRSCYYPPSHPPFHISIYNVSVCTPEHRVYFYYIKSIYCEIFGPESLRNLVEIDAKFWTSNL